MKATVNSLLREKIKAKGIKQRFIAYAVGEDEDKISQILLGNRKLDANLFFKICTAIDEDPATFDPTKIE